MIHVYIGSIDLSRVRLLKSVLSGHEGQRHSLDTPRPMGVGNRGGYDLESRLLAPGNR